MSHSSQLIVVSTPDWSSVDGQARLYERAFINGPWHPVGAAIPAVVGEKGMAWSTSPKGAEAAIAKHREPLKREGDAKSPAGVFLLDTAFGDAAHSGVPTTTLAYRLISPTLECVDDPASNLYNQLIDTADVHKTWHSSENMRRSDSMYNLGVVVAYNMKPVIPGRGSCIFLHIWSGAGIGTAGCTAMPEAAIRKIVAWLDPQKRPVLVQMPRDQLRQFAERWAIPLR